MPLKDQRARTGPLDFESIELSDVIDAPALQDMMNDYYALTGIGIGFIDLKGEVLVGTGWQDICVKFHRVQPESCKFCHESDISLSIGVAPGAFKSYRCKNNMWDIVTPIMLGAKHIGNIFLGQFLYDDEVPDYDLFRAQAKRFGYDETAYITALDRVPRYSRETTNTAMSFYSKLAQMISTSNYQNIQQARFIADRKRMEKLLAENEGRLQTVVQTIPDLIWLKDPDGVFLSCNSMFERLLGAREADIVGKTDYDFVDRELADFFRENDLKAMAAGKPCSNEEMLTFSDDGHQALFDTVKAPMYSADGSLVGVLGIARDISERKKFEKELLEKNSELERFTYSVSHDLKSPLITIMTFAGYMLKDLESGRITHIEGDLKRVADAAARMSMLLDDLLELSRVGSTMNPPTKLDMGQLVNEVLTQLAGRINQHQVTVTVQPDLPALFGDSQRIAMVLQNLVENALKYRGDQPAFLIEIGARSDQKQHVFFVRDNGVGIDPRFHEKIFELFTKLDSKSEGTGIGLSLVKRIIDVHGGKVWVESDGVGAGSTFCFALPRDGMI